MYGRRGGNEKERKKEDSSPRARKSLILGFCICGISYGHISKLFNFVMGMLCQLQSKK